MQRRDFISALTGGAAAAGLAACADQSPQTSAPAVISAKKYRWKMVTTWPPNLPGLATGGANFVAKAIEEMSGGRIEVRIYGGGELVPPFEVFDAVSSGTAELGHGAAYYWKDKSLAAQLFTCVPFGMNPQEMNAWLYFGGGLDLWREVYAEFDLVPHPAGNTGVQAGGWFNREIKSVEDLKGLKMRIPGLGGEVLERAGGIPVSLPGGDIFTALQTGSIDATEWVSPYNDLAFGLHNAAKYYYYPGWHEPGPTLETIVNRRAWESLPDDLQHVIRHASTAANTVMLSEYTAFNGPALKTLVEEHGTIVRPFPRDVIQRLRTLSREVLEELAAKDETFGRVYASYSAFQRDATSWIDISERAFVEARDT
jgi:TRAP-type mannitol/chloroaromatic compound transport system substrate-binding protein